MVRWRGVRPEAAQEPAPDIEDGGGGGEEGGEGEDEGSWGRLLPELLREIVVRVEADGEQWPERRDFVAFAGVCRRWREAVLGIVRPQCETGDITFPSSLKEGFEVNLVPTTFFGGFFFSILFFDLYGLMSFVVFLRPPCVLIYNVNDNLLWNWDAVQPGPRDSPVQCLIRRNKSSNTFYLYLSLTESFSDKGKFLLAARRFKHGANTEYIISLDVDDLSQGSNAYMGKLRSNFFGTRFRIFDSQPPHSGAKLANSRGSRRFASKQISPQVPAGNFVIGQVIYKFNLLKRGPRRMHCAIHCPFPSPPPMQCPCPSPQNTVDEDPPKPKPQDAGMTILRNKAPRWHEHLQCWCLNFHGRVTVASVKNFQLVATADASQPSGVGDEETVLLQFGKVGKDLFTMDYRQPLSAFQAFAISLTSFGTKFACE